MPLTPVLTESECAYFIRLKHRLVLIRRIDAPIPNAPYSQAIKAGNLLFVSGCVPLDKTTMTIQAQGIEAQALQALTNLKAIVEAAGSSLDQIVKTTVRPFLPRLI